MLVALSAAGGGGWHGRAAASAQGRPTRDSAASASHRLRIHHHINVTIRPVAHAAVALQAASQDQAATASPRLSPDDALAQRNVSCRFEAGVDYDRGGGGRAHATGVASKEACCALCKERPSCGVATYLAAFQQCWFKPLDATKHPSKSSAGVVSCIVTERETVPASVGPASAATGPADEESVVVPSRRGFHVWEAQLAQCSIIWFIHIPKTGGTTRF